MFYDNSLLWLQINQFFQIDTNKERTQIKLETDYDLLRN